MTKIKTKIEEIQKSIEILNNPLKHICVEKDGSISYNSDMVRAFELAIEGLDAYKEDLSSSPKSVVIQMKKSDDKTVRRSYMIDKKIADEWKVFNKNVPYKTVTLNHALRRFMDDYKSGLIKFELKF